MPNQDGELTPEDIQDIEDFIKKTNPDTDGNGHLPERPTVIAKNDKSLDANNTVEQARGVLRDMQRELVPWLARPIASIANAYLQRLDRQLQDAQELIQSRTK